ncbi:MAG: hypothetical protein JW910_02255 [Anaerolineae bacterium]|nr:hypothetical protein [Anaerolineae bacterium]
MDHNRQAVHDRFETDVLNPVWNPWTVGTGRLDQAEGVLRCVVESASDQQYSDAQITDYQGLPRRAFPWQPPLRMSVRAWASHSSAQLKGTAGFGFWNEPFVPTGKGLPRLPRAVWFFFASPPNNMALAKDVPGWGWKAATFDATRLPALLLAPAAPVGFLLMRVPWLYRALWPVGQRAIGVSEAPLPVDLADPHDYDLEWHKDSAVFWVDGREVYRANTSPQGPLGFIAWMDNQYAIVTPQGRFRFGRLSTTESQWLALDRVDIQPL